MATAPEPPNVEVMIEYGIERRDNDRFLVIYDRLKRRYPAAKCIGRKGRRNCFEVHIDGKLIFSKLRRGHAPDIDALNDAIIRYGKTGRLPVKVKSSKSVCVLM